MMKRILITILALLICVTAGMAESEHKGGRNDDSMNLLNEGIAFMNGNGVEQDYAQAAPWYEKGVEAGDLTSGYYLGLLYAQGLGVDQDYKKTAEYSASVAASENKSATGVVDAGHELAQMYEQGLGVEQDVDHETMYESAYLGEEEPDAYK